MGYVDFNIYIKKMSVLPLLEVDNRALRIDYFCCKEVWLMDSIMLTGKRRRTKIRLTTFFVLFAFILLILSPYQGSSKNRTTCVRILTAIGIAESFEKTDNPLKIIDSTLDETNSRFFNFAVIEKTKTTRWVSIRILKENI